MTHLCHSTIDFAVIHPVFSRNGEVQSGPSWMLSPRLAACRATTKFAVTAQGWWMPSSLT